MNDPMSFDDLDNSEISDPSTFDVTHIVRKGAVFVIPIDTPVPSEMSEAPVAVGSLYDRLALISKTPEAIFAFCPLSGAELSHLDRAWRLLAGKHDIVALTGLPGGRYDILFQTAIRSIGLKKLDWTSVATELTNQLVANQRTRDATPWKLKSEQDSDSPREGLKKTRKLPKSLKVAKDDELDEPTEGVEE